MPKLFSRCAIALGIVAVLGAGLPSPALADAAETRRLDELQQRLDQSLKLIDALAARIRELEAKTASTPAITTPEPLAEATRRIDVVEQKVAQAEAANASHQFDETSLPIHGFADVGVGTRNPQDPDLKGFNLGNFDLYLTPKLGDHTRALVELNLEVGHDGSVGLDLERVQLGFQFGDTATLWAGRFHTPFGYENTALHHGGWIATSLRRPRFLDFEDHGGILPVHTVGAWATGTVRKPGGHVLWDVYVGNSQQIVDNVIDIRNAGNSSGNLMLGGRLGFEFTSGAAEGLTVGLHGLTSKIADDQSPTQDTRLRVFGAYAVYDTDRFENIAEYYYFSNSDLRGASGNHRSQAGFIQLGYRAGFGVPYLRYERSVLDQSDNFFRQQNSGRSYHRGAAGLRFDLGLKSALKFELANTRDTDRLQDEYSEALVQYAIRF
ncbi:MAG: hypothetical protein RLZZ200_840 [Pseudomonadota bacterium]